MGNQLSGSVPSMILPVERYLSDLNDFDFMGSLGSTRFLKVAKAMFKSANVQNQKSTNNSLGGNNNGDHLSNVEISREGTCVLKVFVIHDPSLPLTPYLKQIDDIKNKLSDSPNCVQFRKIIVTDKAAILIRQFGKDNLYDRLSTRPFLKDVDKRWIAFQLLNALEQCCAAKICHGDIKSQNVLISSWNWVSLTDFASFKPTYLPSDNPADFSYFFDSSRRRTCYIAPERFVSTAELASKHSVLTDEDTLSAASDLLHSMDIFSLGCVLAELFTDGCAPFDFSQLLAYRERRYYPNKCLDLIKHADVRNMIENMLDLDYSKRLSAYQYLDKYRGVVFPEIFYSFLFPYMKQFVDLPRISYDDKIERLFNDMERILQNLKEPSGALSSSYLIFISLITSLIRSLSYCESRLKALNLLKILAAYSKETVILDRILPYVLYMCHDTYARVRVEAVHTVSYVVSLVQTVPKSDTRVFVDYIFPAMNSVITDSSNLVRVALAEEMAILAETAARFLEYASLNSEEDPQVQAGTESFTRVNYQNELRLLQEVVQEMVVTLMIDRDNIIKRTLVANGLPRLCVFFGRQKASDILVSHLITFLNDKNDWRLRASFYECVPALAGYIGWQSTMILKPLLHQGFRDFEENVIFCTLSCLTELARMGLLQKPALNDLIQDAVPFLTHPNLSLRIGAVCFICACSKKLNIADIHCKLTPIIKPYLKNSLIKMNREDILLRSLHEPIPRSMWDTVVRSPAMPDLLAFFKDKRVMRQLGGTTIGSSALPDDVSLAAFYQKLVVLGLTDEIEERFWCFTDILLKMRKMKNSASAEDVSPTEPNRPGVIDLNSINVRRKYADLTIDRGGKRTSTVHKFKPVGSRGNINAMNPEWRQMFGVVTDDTMQNEDDNTPEVSSYRNSSAASPSMPARHHADVDNNSRCDSASILSADSMPNQPARMGDESLASSETTTAVTAAPSQLDIADGGVVSVSIADSINGQDAPVVIDTSLAAETNVRMAQCRSDLASLVEYKRDEWRRAARLAFTEQAGTSDDVPSKSSTPPCIWKPAGELVAHLHEHRNCVNRISVHPSGRFFVSCSSDGTVKLWDCRKMEGRSMSNRSKLTYNKLGGSKIRCVSFLNDNFVCCSDSGKVNVVKFDSGWSKMNLGHQYQTDMENEGHLIQMSAYYDGSTTMIIGASHHGHVICWDTRDPVPVWRFRNPSYHGMVTSMCMDEQRKQWACIGTDSGRLILWDIRFQLPINVSIHPAEKPFYRFWWHPTHHSRVLTSVAGRGEIGEWDLETGTRTSVVWPDTSPPLSYLDEVSTADYPSQKLTTTSLYAYSNVDGASLSLVCGDSDGNLNFWDMQNVKQSYVISAVGSNNEAGSKNRLYKSQIIDGVHVFMSVDGKSAKKVAQSDFSNMKSPTELRATTFHHDAVSDLALCRTTQQLLISASRDGVIKVWK